jgi:hypothetical protein
MKVMKSGVQVSKARWVWATISSAGVYSARARLIGKVRPN